MCLKDVSIRNIPINKTKLVGIKFIYTLTKVYPVDFIVCHDAGIS